MNNHFTILFPIIIKHMNPMILIVNY